MKISNFYHGIAREARYLWTDFTWRPRTGEEEAFRDGMKAAGLRLSDLNIILDSYGFPREAGRFPKLLSQRPGIMKVIEPPARAYFEAVARRMPESEISERQARLAEAIREYIPFKMGL